MKSDYIRTARVGSVISEKVVRKIMFQNVAMAQAYPRFAFFEYIPGPFRKAPIVG